MNAYSMLGSVQTAPIRIPVDSPYQAAVIVAAAIFILLIGGNILRKKRARANRQEEATMRGRKLSGHIIAVKSQTGFDRERKAWHIKTKLRYFDPKLDAEQTIFHTLDREIKNLPPQIGALVGITDVGALSRGYREMKQRRKELEAEGRTKQEIKDEMMRLALEQNAIHPTERDSDDFSIMPKPVPVTVYVSDDKDNTEKGVYVAF